MYHYILFDLDGTLTDPKLGITSCVQYALERCGIEEPDREKLTPFIGPPLLDSFKEFYGFDDEEAQQAIAYYRERFSTVGLFENEVYAGIPQMLRALQGAGRHVAVASSKPTVFVERILKHFGIAAYFEVVVGSELDGTRTKKEDVVEEALRQLLGSGYEVFDMRNDRGSGTVEAGASEDTGQNASAAAARSDIVMVGDRKYDVEGAKAYRIASVGVAYGYAAAGELEAAGADVIVETVEELKKVLTA